ncbi:putative polysaccharide biosynthesis protein [Mesobacillus selenatarsenatis]|uniref:Membrane protein involved in the export of O-antigen, teichoic acid lipoteichoic acids n=1 Tax=Mesobacillus selenatarsenatis (strain DSM 18680 / JCM 14380 / FERM P-15431 / SF-1) TaxID=1321606 RepID=A0A0A8X294_MESS1|nr:polysaccharide biosynthesis protein [Mesobacillus selenatarsenatis]GAM12251.1 membrane protein involved in the export of O-antigen, teichoic acid lipoteichoic acids [Mesobacillus selenatarsenatis SF-1]
MDSKFLRGTFFLTAASLISKILGFIYIIPFTALVGTQGYVLYKYAYGPYTILLSISTIGLPLAVSKFVSKYNEIGNYRVGLTVLRYGMYLMVISGIISFTALYLSAPFLAGILIDPNDQTGNSIEDVQFVIRLVSFALLIIPAISIFRGYFQGSQSMGPSALSTVIEQVVRIVFILAGAYVTIHIFNSSLTNAVGIATFAAFIGGVAGFIVLLFVFFKRRELIKKQRDMSPNNEDIKVISIFKELIGYAIPFVITGLAIPIYQNIDTFTINKLFQSIGYKLDEAETINSVIGLAQILVMVPVSLATAFGLSLIPGITSDFTSGRMLQVRSKISKTMQILLFFTLPAAMGLGILGEPIYIMVFGLENSHVIGGLILQWYSLAAVFFALFTVTAAIMQGINEHKKLIIGIIFGICLKIVLNFILVPYLKEAGPILATYFGFIVSILYNIFIIKKTLQFKLSPLLQSLKEVFLLVLAMSIAVWCVAFLTELWLPEVVSLYYRALVTSIISISVGLLVYLGVGYRLNLIKKLLSNKG